MSGEISDSSDYSTDDIPIMKNKKNMVWDSTDDEDNSSVMESSEPNDVKVPTKTDGNNIITSTPERSIFMGRSSFGTSIIEKKPDSLIISDTDDELSESAVSNKAENVTSNLIIVSSKENSFSTPQPKKSNAYDTKKSDMLKIPSEEEFRKRKSFMTPQVRKQVNDDSDSSEKEVDSDIIDTSQILEDSFEPETPKAFYDEDKKHFTSSIKKTDTSAEKVKVQVKLDDIVKKMSSNDVEDKIKCKRTEYNEQLKMIQTYEADLFRIKKTMSNVNLPGLPDKGQLLKSKFETIKTKFLEAQNRLKQMTVVEEDVPEKNNTEKTPSLNVWNDLEAGIAIVQPKTFGKKGLENFQSQKVLTSESLEQLHGSLKNCPKDDVLAEEPKGIKVSLMEHQRRALAWLLYRETQRPPGGILADDMGLGKTLTMISLVLKKTKHTEEEDDDREEEESSKKYRKYNGGTLVVCPASLLNQWAQEIDTKLKRGLLSYNVYHGPKREVKPKRLAEYDVVITTYSIVMNEIDKEGAIFRVRWNRIILDEAHTIRNHKAQTSVACCELAGKHRWALTGTPVHNKELDMYALLKFLRCSPFDDLAVWKRWVGDKGTGGGERLNTVISTLMLRRTKAELMEQGKLTTMPSRKWDLIPVNLDESEMSLYQKILLFSQTLFAQFLHQRAEKGQEIVNLRNSNAIPNNEYAKMRKKLLTMNQMREVNQHEILVLLLRLRQICCHPSLIVNMLQGDEDLGEDDETEGREEINLLEQLNKLNLDDDQTGFSEEKVGFKEATKGILNPSHPLFAKDRISSKVKSALDLIPNIIASGDKIIVVSQWTSFLELFGWHLKEAGIKFTQLDGRVPTAKRTDMVNNFNDPNSRVKILLLSLTAGGVGLNLVGANHLFLLDLHWNPQLEKQAQDRIYRMGQKKNVFVYKFMTHETIEERIKNLQDAKIAISESMLTGSKIAVGNKLSLQDLKMLFNM